MKKISMKDTTAIIKTFWRDQYLYKCIKSLRKFYPDIKIIVGDDGYESIYKTKFLKKMKCEYIRLPFDCGITYGRNKLIEKAKTKYVLIGDDDFEYNEDSPLYPMKKMLEKFDIAGGRVNTLGKLENYQGSVNKVGNTLIFKEFDLKDLKEYKGMLYGECDIIFNFFIAKREVFKKVKWDENIKVAYEHSDFFLDAKDVGIKVAFLSEPIVKHKDENIRDVANYTNFRSRKSDKDYFFKKHKINCIIDFKGRENRI